MTRGDTRRALSQLFAALRGLLSVRWMRWVAILLLLGLGTRLALTQLLAKTINVLAAERGLVCTWENLSLTILSGRGEVHMLELHAKVPEGAPPAPDLFNMEFAVFDLDVLALLSGELRISRAEVDGLDSWWTRAEGGEWNVAQHIGVAEILALLESEEATEPEPEERATLLQLNVPLAIESLRFQHAICHISDHDVQPPLELTLEMTARLSSLSDPDRPLRFSATVLAGDLLDAAHVEGTAHWSADTIDLELRAQAGSLRPRELAQYLDPLDIHPVAESLEARLLAKVHVAVLGEARDALSASVELSQVHLMEDGVESLALDRFLFAVDSISAAGASSPGIELQGIRAHAALQEDRSLHIAGFDISGTRWLDAIAALSPPVQGETPPATPTDYPLWLALLFEEDAKAYAWSLAAIDVRDGLIDFTDRTVEPAAAFPVYIDTFQIGEVDHVPGQVTRTIPLHAALRAPGMMESISVQGSFEPFAPQRRVDLELQVDGIVLNSLERRMQRLGIERTLQKGSFHAHLVGEAQTDAQGRTTGNLSVERISLKDTDELFGIESLRVSEILIDPAQNLLRLGDVEVSGTHMTAGRSPTRHFFGLGLQFLSGSDAPESEAPAPGAMAATAGADSAATANTPAAQSSVPLVLPRLELGRFAWVDTQVEFVDALSDPPQHFTVDELAVELTNLSLGGAPGGPAREPAAFSAHITAPGILDDLLVDGTIHSSPGPIDLRLAMAVRGDLGSGELVKPYLVAFGVEPTFGDAQLTLDLHASLKQEPTGWLVGLALADASLTDGGALLLSCEELRVDDLRLADGIELDALEVHAPRAHARRDANGALVVAGVRLVTPPSANQEPSSEPQTVKLELPPLPDVLVHRAQIADAHLILEDATFEPKLAAELVLDATLLDFRTDGSAGTYSAHLEVPEVLESLDATGELTLGPEALGITAEVIGEGVRAGPLARLLPPGLELESSAGHLQADLRASLTPAAQGGLRIDLEAKDCSWGERDAEPWAAARRVQLVAPRVDLDAGVILLGPIVAEGLRAEGARDADGTLHVFGLALRSVAEPAPQTRATDLADVAASEAAAPPASALQLTRVELVDEVSFQLEHLRLRDASLGAEARAIEAGAKFTLQTPLVILSDKPRDLPPIAWRAEGTLAGLVEQWTVEGELAPFASEPRFAARFDASGVRTAGVVESVPQLAELLSGEVEQGTLHAGVSGTLFVRRARPMELGLARPFGAELLIEDVAYRDAPGGTILAGVDRISADVKRIDAAKQLVHVDTLEILNPRGFVERQDMLLHVLGFGVQLAPQTSDSGAATVAVPVAEEIAPEPEQEAVLVEAAANTADAPPEVVPELRIDQLIVSGIDFEIRDSSVEPALRIPFSELDVEVKRFTTRALREPLPIQFSSYLQSGVQEGSQLFEEIAVSGRVVLFPTPSGWVQCSMTALELPYLAPLAAQQGLDIKDGALDASARLRLKGEDGANVDTSLVFTDLSLDEPEGGWIERVLSLPMALDSALFLLKNASDEHRFSAGFHVDEAGISTAQIVGAASGAFAEVLGRALAAVPLRMLGAFLPGGDEPEEAAREAWALAFAPGTVEPSRALAADLQAALEDLQDDSDLVLVLRHELTPADVSHAERLANPSASICKQRIAGLRQRKAELLRARSQVATETSALYAIGDPAAGAAGERLRAREQQLATLEDTLDGLFEILRSNSERQRLKRTRATAREIAELRLQALQSALQGLLPAEQAERIQVRAPRFQIGESDAQVHMELRQG